MEVGFLIYKGEQKSISVFYKHITLKTAQDRNVMDKNIWFICMLVSCFAIWYF